MCKDNTPSFLPAKERLILRDGVMDISGPYTCYTQKEPEEEKLAALPYTTAELSEAKSPDRFLDFLASAFPDEKTAETVLFYLSLVVSKNTKFKYGGIFIGGHETGKTALITILAEAMPGYIKSYLIQKFQNKPIDLTTMAFLGAAVIEETDSGSYIQTALYKTLTSGDTLTGRFLRRPPFQFIPTAQLIIISNHLPQFISMDDALAERLVFIPFLSPHRRGEPETMPVSEIIKNLRPEFPAIVKMLADYYVRLKHKYNGIIPQSKQCKILKKSYLSNLIFLKCEYCKEQFHVENIIIENDQDHCPYCGSVVKQALPRTNRRQK
jgi:phage/plasmid-associated DNA primase